MKLYLILVSSIYFFCGCNNKNNEVLRKSDSNTSVVPGYIEKNKTDSLINRAVNLNDTIAYNNASVDFFMQNRGNELLYYSMIMAYKNGSAQAYFHIYDIIAYSTPKEPKEALEIFGDKTKTFAMYHLLKSYEMGYENAKYQLQEQFSPGEKIPSSNFYLKKYYEGELTR